MIAASLDARRAADRPERSLAEAEPRPKRCDWRRKKPASRSTFARAPAARRLIRLAGSEHIALVTMHHIVSDGWSMNVFVRELAVLYAAFSAGRPSPLPPLPIQYADYAEWQREWLQGEVPRGRNRLSGKEKLGGSAAHRPRRCWNCPGDRPRPAVQTANGSTLRTKLPPQPWRRAERAEPQEGATLFMTLLAAFYALLHRYTGQTDICVGTPIANRRQAELEPLIGLFINTLVLAHRHSNGEHDVPRAASPREGSCAGGVRAPGPALRDDRGRSPTRTGHEPLDALPGHVHPARTRVLQSA